MSDGTRAQLVRVVLEELGRDKAVQLAERIRREVKGNKKFTKEIGSLHLLLKWAFPDLV